jgi:hypothetical protein
MKSTIQQVNNQQQANNQQQDEPFDLQTKEHIQDELKEIYNRPQQHQQNSSSR